ncbi:hypothetical protein [Bacillus sp. FJAT-28004]|uniref:hypothetical protein n=1 Tax=Bacillus sp. FJAT-28004 TaxID=1679165 RepID=UPI0006B4A249|nr:hypothetical protein [Bacillus sp. FJAT-28004]
MSINIGVVREDVRRLNKEFYSLKDKDINFYKIPHMKYLVASGVNDRDIYRMYDYKEIWTIGRFINRFKYYTKREINKNFSRMPIEIEWGRKTETGTEFKVMMWVPDYIDEDLFTITMADLKNRHDLNEVNLSLNTLPNRLCAQLLHKGNYSNVEASKQILVEDLRKDGYLMKGNPQEIFMNHPHCNPPERLNILLRQEIIAGRSEK